MNKVQHETSPGSNLRNNNEGVPIAPHLTIRMVFSRQFTLDTDCRKFRGKHGPTTVLFCQLFSLPVSASSCIIHVITMVHSDSSCHPHTYEKRLKLAAEDVNINKSSVRKAAKAFGVSHCTLNRRLKFGTANVAKVGRPPALRDEEEKIIAAAVVEWARNETPLSRKFLKGVVQVFIQQLPEERQKSIPISQQRPGDKNLKTFLFRHPELSLKRRSCLENSPAETMNEDNLARHFARLHHIYKEYKSSDGQQVFNLDESGFSTRTASRARAKAVMETCGMSNAVGLKWSANAYHVTLMPVASADGTAWRPIAILSGKRHKWRKRDDGIVDTPATVLVQNAILCHRDPAGMDSLIF